MQLRYNFRVYPDAVQRTALARAFGCARVVFNDGLRLRQQAREAGEKYVSDADLSKRVITQAKGTPERAWLGEVSAVVLQQALADLNTAYRNFFSSITGKRKGPHGGTAPVPVPQEQPASDPVHQEQPVQGPRQRPTSAAKDRRHAGSVVA
ncbi:transposase [Micromonospora luteifusca]|uniref:Transposase n=1 Tax=Micromonospora luteifusca TaxID=709860 RepID=A0ABS2LMK3_9ACTN|nr:helix-turn-helix domain-containing protein [Micromonospora luteifusca]MBM7489420.1 transposase [Micromonospora luteifusca]